MNDIHLKLGFVKGRSTKDKIVKIVRNSSDKAFPDKDPLQGISKHIENARRGATTKRKAKIEEVLTLPAISQEGPIVGVDWAEAKGVLDVDFSHVATRAHQTDHVKGFVEGGILDMGQFYRDAIIDR